MRKALASPSYIIVLGTTYSGSGAVWDYLAGRGDLHDPLCGEEYQLPQVPQGLMNLEAVAGHAFHPASADYALSMFEEIVRRLARPNTFWGYGKGYSRKLPLFDSAIKSFLDEITTAHLPMHLDWHKLMQSPQNRLIDRLSAHLRISKTPRMTRLLVSQGQVVSAAQALHDKVMKSGARGKSVILNQSGSGWNPIESTKYFRDRKAILVTRDPRDQFADLKKRKKALSVYGFVEWYTQMQRRLNGISDPSLLKIRFEDFVRDHGQSVGMLSEHCGINDGVISGYRAEESLPNIGQYQRYLSHEEKTAIQRSLSDYCVE